MKKNLIWELADMFNQLMVIPNVPALLALSALVAASVKGDYALKQSKKERQAG